MAAAAPRSVPTPRAFLAPISSRDFDVIQVAAHQLRKSDMPARIAEQVGHEAEAAFNRAFKRALGVPPTTWRKSTSGAEAAHHRAK
jgi:methylphosphotriester-DNA--protein-cysteine methyltransferase